MKIRLQETDIWKLCALALAIAVLTVSLFAENQVSDAVNGGNPNDPENTLPSSNTTASNNMTQSNNTTDVTMSEAGESGAA
jgi:hypothetical protein